MNQIRHVTVLVALPLRAGGVRWRRRRVHGGSLTGVYVCVGRG